jgi:DNA-directed RNA polymerase subunit F
MFKKLIEKQLLKMKEELKNELKTELIWIKHWSATDNENIKKAQEEVLKINSEEYLDKIVDRIMRKQLK